MAGLTIAALTQHLVSAGFGALLLLAAQAYRTWREDTGRPMPPVVNAVVWLGWLVIVGAAVSAVYTIAGTLEPVSRPPIMR